jgi:hypothetical protein
MGSHKYNDTNMNLHKLQNVCGSIGRTDLEKAQKEIILKFYNLMAISVLFCGFECWSSRKQKVNRI